MKLTMLGTGNAGVTECYHTCFLLSNAEGFFLVDGGGGSQLMHQLDRVGVYWREIHEIFVTHRHLDHLTGILWLMRWVCSSMSRGSYAGEVKLYANGEVIGILRDMLPRLLPESATCIGDRLHLIAVEDGETRSILGRRVTFFDIYSSKAQQMGFCMELEDGQKLCCCGDEPCHESCEPFVLNSKWLLHEAFCLDAEAERYHPERMQHSTVKNACMLAERLHVKNLLLYHTEDRNLPDRKALYSAEGQRFYHGNLFVPDDLEQLEL